MLDRTSIGALSNSESHSVQGCRATPCTSDPQSKLESQQAHHPLQAEGDRQRMATMNTTGKIYGYDEDLWYDVIRREWKSGDRDIGRILSILRRLNAGKSILDLGCGVGRISSRLAKNGYSVLGIDLSEKCVTEAAKLANELGVAGSTRYLVGNYLHLEELTDERFDVATCILASSWNSMVDLKEFLKKLAGFMNPSAVLIIQDTVNESFVQTLTSCPAAQRWFSDEGGLLALHSWSYDCEHSVVKTEKKFYRSTGSGFAFITQIERTYCPPYLSEFTDAIGEAGWEIVSVERPTSFNPVGIGDYNDPWLLFSATISARLK